MRRGVRPGLAHAGVAVRGPRGPVADGREGPALVAGPVGPVPGREPVLLVVASGRNAEPKPRALRADRLGGFVLVGVPAVGVSPKLFAPGMAGCPRGEQIVQAVAVGRHRAVGVSARGVPSGRVIGP